MLDKLDLLSFAIMERISIWKHVQIIGSLKLGWALTRNTTVRVLVSNSEGSQANLMIKDIHVLIAHTFCIAELRVVAGTTNKFVAGERRSRLNSTVAC